MSTFNGEHDVFDAENVEELLARHGIEPRGVAVAIDGDVVRRSEWATTIVRAGSRVEVVTAAAGG